MTDEELANPVAMNQAMRENIASRNEEIAELENSGLARNGDTSTARDFYDARERFKEEYPDYWNDQTIRDFLIREDERLVNEGDTRDYFDRYAAIADEVKRQLAGKEPKVIAPKQRYVSPEQRAIYEMAEARKGKIVEAEAEEE